MVRLILVVFSLANTLAAAQERVHLGTGFYRCESPCENEKAMLGNVVQIWPIFDDSLRLKLEVATGSGRQSVNFEVDCRGPFCVNSRGSVFPRKLSAYDPEPPHRERPLDYEYRITLIDDLTVSISVFEKAQIGSPVRIAGPTIFKYIHEEPAIRAAEGAYYQGKFTSSEAGQPDLTLEPFFSKDGYLIDVTVKIEGKRTAILGCRHSGGCSELSDWNDADRKPELITIGILNSNDNRDVVLLLRTMQEKTKTEKMYRRVNN